MAESFLRRMTVKEFIPWAMARPETEHYELIAGEVVARAPERAMHSRDPVIVAEILSPSTSAVDTGNKFVDYFRLASLRHYLLLRPDKRVIIHHECNAHGDIATRVVHDGTLRLNLPGIDVTDIFGEEP